MDNIGKLELTWAQGYDGSQASYINKNTICFRCGNNVKFVHESGSTEDELSSIFPSGCEALGPIAVHPVNKVFAITDIGIEPKIRFYDFPEFKPVQELKGGAELEFHSVIFSHSDYVATVTGVPDFKLIIWNYVTGERLCEENLKDTPPTAVTFNPTNWREICVSYSNELCVYKIEQSDNLYILQKHKLRLPAENSNSFNYDNDSPTRPQTASNMSHTVQLPVSSMAGVKGETAIKFEEYQDLSTRVKPRSHCWLPTGDLLIGCAGGQMLKINIDIGSAIVLYKPEPRPSSSGFSREPSGNVMTIQEANESLLSEDIGDYMADGTFNCLALHKTGLIAGGLDGKLRRIDIGGNQFKLLETHALGSAITSLSFNTLYTKIAVGSDMGSINIAATEDFSTITPLFDIHCGKFVAIDVIAPGIDFCVTARANGELQIWNIESSKQESSISIGLPITAMAASPFGHVVVVGTDTGHLFYVDATKISSPRIIKREHMHSGPVKQITFNKVGTFMVTGSDDGHVFVIDGRCTENFLCMGFVAMNGEIQGISLLYNVKSEKTKVVVTSNESGFKDTGATRIMHFVLPGDLSRNLDIKHQSLKWELKDSLIEKLIFNFANPSDGIAISDPTIVFTLTHNTKQLHKLELPNEPPKKEYSKDSYLKPITSTLGHQLPGGRIKMSPHLKWIASVGADGVLAVRAVGNLERPASVNGHDFRLGGASDVCFTADTFKMLTVGPDGSIVCYSWDFQQNYLVKARNARQAVRDHVTEQQNEIGAENAALEKHHDWNFESLMSLEGEAETRRQETIDKEKAIDEAIERDEIFNTPTPVAGADATWIQTIELEAHSKENMQYADVKKDLRENIRDMRRQLQAMMKENEQVPDIEKLEHHDFDLDVEEQQRLQEEGEGDIARIREDKELENLAKMYIADIIKQECWYSMVVKGRGISAFHSGLEVHNYPMRQRSRQYEEKLDTIKVRRRIEIAELAQRKDIAEIYMKSMEEEEPIEEEDTKADMPSTSGSLGAYYGAASDLFYTQFEIHTREEKNNQILLLEDAIYLIKEFFNKEFDEVYSKKENELSKIKDKNKRIIKIVSDLDLPDEVYQPTLSSIEKPELLLKVEDHEVKVEKYYTPEQRRQMEEEKKLEEERRLREKQDNWRDRGLDKMMNGVLEIKKEDELKKDVPKPPFMIQKAEAEWSEDEMKLVLEYEKKVKDLEEEREKYRKQLDLELKKLQGIIQEHTDQFDDALKILFMRKIKTEMVIYQEELKIVRLKNSLLIEEEFGNREGELVDHRTHQRTIKILSLQAVAESKKCVEQYRDLYDTLQAEDKVMDRDFRRKFHDIPAHHSDMLYKLFRRRPRGQKVRGVDTPIYDPNSGNPFGDRPPTARQNASSIRTIDTALRELDQDRNCPDGIDSEIWLRLCTYRRQKIESERLVQQRALILAEMQAFLQRRQDEDEKLFTEIETLHGTIKTLRLNRNRFNLDLEVQLMLKQGQVEVDMGKFIADFSQSLLVHRHVVEDLNGKVRGLGESKIASMEDSKVFRKGIVMLEWEHRKMTMEMGDLQKKVRDIQNMKVTREIQRFLTEADYEARKAHDISILEQTLIMLKQNHERNIEEKDRILNELKRSVRSRDGENHELSNELEELNVGTNERRHIHEVNADKHSSTDTDQQYREIVQRRKLVDLAKAQAQEVAVLRAEVERLRMRTFPALVQVEH